MSELDTGVQVMENMKVCNNCGAKIKEDSLFCTSCGKPVNIVPSKVFCSRCGSELNETEMFCHNCGSPTMKSQNAEVLNNIAAYNDSIGKPKKKASVVNIKNHSVFAFIAWILTALFVGLLSIRFTKDIAYANSFHAMMNLQTKYYIIGLLSFTVATITGILFWNNDNKMRLMPVIASLIATVSCTMSFEQDIGAEIIVADLLMHIAVILFALNAVKTNTLLLTTSITSIVLSLLIPLFAGYEDVLPFVLSIPMFLLTFTFTTKELKETSKKKMRSWKLIAFVISVLLVLSGVGSGLYQSWVYVGDVSNLNVETAKGKYSRLVVQTEYEYSDTVEKDFVIKQSVKKGSFIHPYKKLTLTVSKGAGVIVPKVVDLTLADAKKKLEDLGLNVKTIYDYSSSVARDNVIKVSGYHVDEGATVTLTVSKGPDPRVTVPDVIDMTELEAREELQNHGFKVTVEYVYRYCDAYEESSEVKWQSLTGLQTPGSTVTIKVTKPSISITRVYFNHNTVGGVDIDISFKNTSSKTIKYVVFKARFKDSSGSEVYCSIRNSSTQSLKYTGPLNPGRSETAYWDAVIYNWNCSQIHFDGIEVTFTDGTTHTMKYNGYWY